MTVRIVKDGLEIRVDTADELQMVMSALGNSLSSKTPTQVVEPKSLAEFYKDMDKFSMGYRVLTTLRENPDGMSDVELREKLGTVDNKISGQVLGGTFAGITKQAKKAGLESSDITESRLYRVDEEKPTWAVTHYKLTKKMLEAMSK